MNKSELVKALSEKTGFTMKDSEKFLNSFIETTEEILAGGDSINLVGFGSFEVTERGPRTARDFKTGKSIEVAASKSVKFKAGKCLKDAVAKK